MIRAHSCCSLAIVRRMTALTAALLFSIVPAYAQNAPSDHRDVWAAPSSSNRAPHFEHANGRSILYVDGLPFTALAVEIPWWHLIAGRYKQTEDAYDALYPAAAKIGLNTLKVPVKWSMVEPEKGVYDFSYIDHAKQMAESNHLKLVLNWFGHYASGDGTIYRNLTGELFAPLYIVQDDKTYPRAVDANGNAHHNVASYDYPAIIDREVAAYTAFIKHIRDVDSQTHTIIMIQVENEIAVFGADRKNKALWRDHTAASNQRFATAGIPDELQYSAWDLSSHWIRRITDEGAAIYPIPQFHNFVGGQLSESIVGGSPGEDVATYLKECPNLAFIGVNAYQCAEWLPDNSCNRAASGTADELRAALNRYKVSRNVPAITEVNSGKTPVTSRFAYVAVGEFGVPIFAPWALTDSYPEPYQPYVDPDGKIGNGAAALSDAYRSLSAALPEVVYYAGSDAEKVFFSPLPGQRFSTTAVMGGVPIKVEGDRDGEAIVIRRGEHEFVVVGYRVAVSFKDPAFAWPALQSLAVETGRWIEGKWVGTGNPTYGIDQATKTMDVDLTGPAAVRVSW